MPPGDATILESQLRIERFQTCLPLNDRLVEIFDLSLLDSLRQEMRIDGFAGRRHVAALRLVAPRADHPPVPHDAAAPADEVPEQIQPTGVHSGFSRCAGLP